MEDCERDVPSCTRGRSGLKALSITAVTLRKGEKIIEFSNSILELVSELQRLGHQVFIIKQKRAFTTWDSQRF